jgi:hypothetical protein
MTSAGRSCLILPGTRSTSAAQPFGSSTSYPAAARAARGGRKALGCWSKCFSSPREPTRGISGALGLIPLPPLVWPRLHRASIW